MRVCIVPEHPVHLMTGGLQVQALQTHAALARLLGSENAVLFRWSEDARPADLYHFIGTPPHMAPIARFVAAAHRPYVVTSLLGGAQSGLARLSNRLRRRLKDATSPDGLTRLHREAAAVVVLTDGDADSAATIFGIARDRIHVVPNGVAPAFQSPCSAAWREKFGDRPFVLCVGAIQPRKNQLLLLRLCNRLRLPAVLLGPTLPGMESYGADVAREQEENARFGGIWLADLRDDSPLLASAYAACRLFVLLSRQETQPLSVMEAMAAQRPVLLLDAPYARENLFAGLPRLSLSNETMMAGNLRLAWDNPSPTRLPGLFTWDAAARGLAGIYQDILAARPPRHDPPAETD